MLPVGIFVHCWARHASWLLSLFSYVRDLNTALAFLLDITVTELRITEVVKLMTSGLVLRLRTLPQYDITHERWDILCAPKQQPT